MNKIPLAKPDLGGNEEEYAVDAIRSTWISSSGQYIARFEEQFALLTEAEAAIGVSNGTIALHLALLGLGVRPGDEVLVPAMTYVATANAALYVGAVPVFVDSDPSTWCIDPGKLEQSITPRTKGIIAVHLYGHPADMDEINRIADSHDLWVVEDAAEAHFANYKGRPVGNLATLATFSFYGNKIITCGEGGAITLSDQDLEQRLRLLKGQGMAPDRKYFFPITGYNFRLSNVACSLLCAQLERWMALLDQRRHIFELYQQELAEIPGLGFQPVADWAEPAPWLFCITIDEVDFGASRSQLMRALEAQGIETRPFFIPMHRLPPFRDCTDGRVQDFPVSEWLGQRGINLPTYSGMQDDQVSYVCNSIRQFQRQQSG